MKRILLLTGLAAALAAPAAAQAEFAPFTTYDLCGSRCASFSANGGGTVSQRGYGVTWGTIGSGTVTVTDLTRNGRVDWRINGASRHVVSGDAHVYRGSNMTFLASTRWRVSIHGRQISLSTVASGWAYVRGGGSYHLNGASQAQRWPAQGKTITLQR